MLYKKPLSLLLACCLVLTGVVIPSAAAETADSAVTVTALDSGSQIVEAASPKAAFDYRSTTPPLTAVVLASVGGNMQPITTMYRMNEAGEKEILKGEDGHLIMESGDIAFMLDNAAMMKAAFKEIGTILRFLFTGSNKNLAGSIANIFDAALKDHYFNPDGTRAAEDIVFETEEYNYSVAVAATKKTPLQTQAGRFYKYNGMARLNSVYYHNDMKEYCELVNMKMSIISPTNRSGTYTIARRLNAYVENVVKAQTGAEKVNLVFISLGGTISTAYFDLYARTDEMNELHKVIFADSAVDGSYLLSDILNRNLSLYDSDYLRTEMIPDLLTMKYDISVKYAWAGWLGGIVLRILPEKWLHKLLDSAAEGLKTSYAKTCGQLSDHVVARAKRRVRQTRGRIPCGSGAYRPQREDRPVLQRPEREQRYFPMDPRKHRHEDIRCLRLRFEPTVPGRLLFHVVRFYHPRLLPIPRWDLRERR